MNLSDTERGALSDLVAALGTVLVMDVTATPVASAATWDAPAVRTAKCACCGIRRDLVAFTVQTAGRADLCRACGHDRVCGRECTSKPRAYAGTFNPADWEV